MGTKVMMDNVRTVLGFLASLERDETGRAPKKRDELPKDLDMSLAEINDSIEQAEKRGWVKCESGSGVILEAVATVEITAEGRLWLECV